MAHVLLIDDDSTLIPAQVRQAFPSPQYTVHVASTGALGVELMRRQSPDVVFYRLSVFSIHLAPLRERGDDILLLVQHYLGRFSAELGRDIRSVAPEALHQLREYRWPGNVRELQSVLKQALLYASGNVLLSKFLPALDCEPVPSSATPVSTATPVSSLAQGVSAPGVGDRLDIEAFVRQRIALGTNDVHAEAYRQVDRLLFTVALEFTRGNLRDAAAVLGISRQTMRLRLRALGMSQGRTVELGVEPSE